MLHRIKIDRIAPMMCLVLTLSSFADDPKGFTVDDEGIVSQKPKHQSQEDYDAGLPAIPGNPDFKIDSRVKSDAEARRDFGQAGGNRAVQSIHFMNDYHFDPNFFSNRGEAYRQAPKGLKRVFSVDEKMKLLVTPGILRKGKDSLNIRITGPSEETMLDSTFTDIKRNQSLFFNFDWSAGALRKYGFGNYAAEVRKNGQLVDKVYFAITR